MNQVKIISALKLTTRPKPDPVNPTITRQTKLISKLEEQHAMVTSMLQGEKFIAYKNSWVVDESGEKRKIKKSKKLRAWYYQANNIYYFEVKYGSRSLELQKGKSAIEVGTKENLLVIINTIIEAVKEGELDSQLAQIKGPVRSKK